VGFRADLHWVVGTRSNKLNALLQFRALAREKDDPSRGGSLARWHLVFGWWSVFAFAALGLTLETLHGFKVRAYLDVSNETRRLMWTLAHAHGALLGLIHIAFAVSLPWLDGANRRLTSRALVAASVLLPGGFFLGGVRFYAGDPGLGVALVPVGAVLLLTATWLIARGIR
jgi:hypothetical protein